HQVPPRAESTTSDLLSAVDDWDRKPAHLQRAAREFETIASEVSGVGRIASEVDFRRAVFAGYPDRVAQRRAPDSPSLRLASGTGAVLGSESGVRDGEFLAVIDVQTFSSSAHVPVNQPRVCIASLVDREWLEPTRQDIEHRFDPQRGDVRAYAVDRYDTLVLG